MMKLQITVSEDMVKEIDKYAKMMGISRSALCATFIGQGIMGYNRSFQAMDNISEGFVQELQKRITDLEGE